MIASRTSIITSLTCVAVIALATATTSMANLIVNAGFESEAAPGAPTDWSLNPYGGTIQTSDAYAHSGLQSLSIDSTGAGAWTQPNAIQSFTASEGQVFNLSGYMFTPTVIADVSSGLLKIEFRDSVGTLLAPAEVTIGTSDPWPFPGAVSARLNADSPANTWIFAEAEAEAPANTASVFFYAINVNEGLAPQAIYFDSVAAVPEPTSLALLGLALVGLRGFLRRK